MKKYYLTNSFIHLYQDDGSIRTFYFNRDSGNVYYRLKIDTISEVKHTGIYLGVDDNGIHHFIHNHYEVGQPCIVDLQDFSKGQDIHRYVHTSQNANLDIIKRGIEEVIRGERYQSLNYNCQTLINIACNNVRQSEDVSKWSGRLLLGGLIFLGIAAFSKK